MEEDVIILEHMSVILDVNGLCKNVYIYGNLTFSDTIDLTFDAYNIFVMGTGRLTVRRSYEK